MRTKLPRSATKRFAGPKARMRLGLSTRPHGGIYVSTRDNLGFAPRQQVRVTGTLADNVQPGLLVLNNVTDTKVHGSGPKVQPLPVATGAVGEATEGKLVRITGTIMQPAAIKSTRARTGSVL